MEPTDAARAARRLEPLHSLVYFCPEAGEELGELGVEHPRTQYFAQRSAAMGAVGPGVVAATFYNFNPQLIARSVPHVWAQATPAAVVNARYRAVDRALRRLLGEDGPTGIGSPAVREAGDLARHATEGATGEDRPLYAAHADLPWPDEPHLMLWHALTLLREHRGDAHLHALVSGGLSGIESIVTHVATGKGFVAEFAQQSRGWSPEQWGAASEGLAGRGLLERTGELTSAGRALREEIELHTSRMSLSPWKHLGEQSTARLVEVAAPLVSAVLANGAFPAGIFASGSDRAQAAGSTQ